MARETTLDGPPVRLRVGLIGTGLAVRRLHWPALDTLRDRFEVVAFADPSRSAAIEFAAAAGLSMDAYSADPAALLARPDVDVVLVAVPIRFSREVAAAALDAGKHVLCEKPAGGSVAEGRMFLELAGRFPHRVFMVAENFFYRDDLRYAQHLVRSCAIGELRLVDFRFMRRTLPAPGEFVSTAWRLRPQHRGGIHLDVGVHHMAQIRMLCGEPVAVHALRRQPASSTTRQDVTPGERPPPDADEPETFPELAMQLRFAHGAIGSYVAAYDAVTEQPEQPGAQMHLYGADGTLVLQGKQVRLVRVDGTRETRTFETCDGGYRNEWLDFHRAICEGTLPIGTVAQSFRNLLVIMRALDSADRGATMAIERAGSAGCPRQVVPPAHHTGARTE